MTRVQILLEQVRAAVPGGTGRYAVELARALCLTAPDGSSVEGLVARSPEDVHVSVPVSEVGLPVRVLARLWERGLGPRAGRGFDIVHAPTLLVPPTRRSQRLVVTVHDVVPWTHPETLTRRGVAFHRRMGARAARKADLIVTPTAAIAGQVRSLLDPGCPVEVLYPGVATLPPQRAQVSRQLADRLPLDPFVLFVGTAEPRKGLDILVQALGLPTLAGVQLVVIGPTGWGDVDVAELARRAGVGNRVHILGRVTDEELASAYAVATVLAVPSRAEGFGLPVVEAMAAGLPVVTSDDPALCEVAADAALAVPIGDAPALATALARVLNDPSLRHELANRGVRRAEAFDWRLTGHSAWGLYRRTMGLAI